MAEVKNFTPEIDLKRQNRFWIMDQIYTGPGGAGRIVPNVNDFVLDWASGTYRVIGVDTYGTHLAHLTRINLATLGGGVDESDVAVVTGPGINSNSFRILVDTSVVPHRLAVDSRVIWNGSANHHIKIYRGSEIDAKKAAPISAVLNQSNQIISSSIPLENIIIPNGTNVSQKTATVAWCSEAVTDGEICTVVTETAAGTITSIDKFVIKTTNFIRTIDQSAIYVTDIELLTPFMSATDSRLIECPINMITQSLMFTAKVTYSDGKSKTYPIDGTKFSLAGMSSFVASQIGQTIPVTLVYNLSDNELVIGGTPNLPDRRYTKQYNIKTIEIDTFYSVKLFVTPQWGNDNRYTLKYWLYDLERKDIRDVTTLIEYAPGKPAFVGNQYGTAQQLSIALNMQKLGPTYSYFRHVQNITVTLVKPGSTPSELTYYTIAYNDSESYGNNVRAYYTNDEQNAGKMKMNLACGYTDVDTWITNIYRKLDPLHYDFSEPRAPAPTHAKIIVGTFQREIPINKILEDIRDINVGIGQGNPVRVQLFARAAENDQQLAMAPMVATAMT